MPRSNLIFPLYYAATIAAHEAFHPPAHGDTLLLTGSGQVVRYVGPEYMVAPGGMIVPNSGVWIDISFWSDGSSPCGDIIDCVGVRDGGVLSGVGANAEWGWVDAIAATGSISIVGGNTRLDMPVIADTAYISINNMWTAGDMYMYVNAACLLTGLITPRIEMRNQTVNTTVNLRLGSILAGDHWFSTTSNTAISFGTIFVKLCIHQTSQHAVLVRDYQTGNPYQATSLTSLPAAPGVRSLLVGGANVPGVTRMELDGFPAIAMFQK